MQISEWLKKQGLYTLSLSALVAYASIPHDALAQTVDQGALQQQTEQAAPVEPVTASQGPLKVVIPNVHDKTVEIVKSSNAAQKDSAIVTSAPAIQPAPHVAHIEPTITFPTPSSAQTRGTKIPASNELVFDPAMLSSTPASSTPKSNASRATEAASVSSIGNGLFFSADTVSHFVQSVKLAVIEVYPLPANWVTPQQDIADAQNPASTPIDLTRLSPSAGGDIQPLIATPQANNNADTNTAQPVEPVKPVLQAPSPNAQPPAVINAQIPVIQLPAPVAVKDATEPAPTLSDKSKVILHNLPQRLTKNTPPPQKKEVTIDHRKEAPDLFANSSPDNKAKSGLGIKMGTQKPVTDVNYDLTRAYDALIAGQTENAIQIYQDILTTDPKNKQALFGLATTYHRVGQIDTARALYAKLLDIDPTNRDALNNFLVLLSDEAPGEAMQKMEEMENKNPGFSPIPAQLALLYQKLGQNDKAIDKMYRALAISPENITYRYNLAILLDHEGKYEEAAKLYKQVLEAHDRGENIPSDAAKIQQRLTFISSNRPS